MEPRTGFSIALATPADEPELIALGESADMGTLKGFNATLVARFDDGRLAGFCRIRIFDGIAYVNPIVSSSGARGMGVGSALMQAAREAYGELRFVARGSAVPFYRSLGCLEISWDAICDEVASDCDGCAAYETCRPLPMALPSTLGDNNTDKPLIGIVSDIDFESNLCSINHEYETAVWAAGGTPLLIAPLNDSPAYVSAMARAVDGIILAGGGDIDPRKYGIATPHPLLENIHPTRDSFEIALVRHAHELKIPVLGICRGLQVMNVAFGGSLIQHIDEGDPHTTVPAGFPSIRSSESANANIDAFIDHSQPKPYSAVSHFVAIETGTNLHSIFGGQTNACSTDQPVVLAVNSMHHQAIDELAPALTASARCGCVIEAIEDSSEEFFIGVQWHPEYLENGQPLFEALCRAATNRKRPERIAKLNGNA